MYGKYKVMTTILLVVTGLLLFAGIASAKNVDNPAPTCPSGYTFDKTTASCIAVTNGNTTATANIGDKSVSAQDIATAKVTVGEDMNVKPSVTVNSPQCFWTHGGFWNSVNTVIGPRSYWDPVPGKLCPSKASPSHYVKVAGGTTGRNCGNPASAKRPVYRVVTGKVLSVRSFANVPVNIKANVAVEVHDTCGSASASASASVVVNLREYIRSKGQVSANLYAQVVASATAKASAQIVCVPIPTPPTPPTPPGTAHIVFCKQALTNNAPDNIAAGQFRFTLLINGNAVVAFGNPATNQANGLGCFDLADVACGSLNRIEETGPGGYTPDTPAQEWVAVCGQTHTFVFVNRRTTSTPPTTPPTTPTPAAHSCSVTPVLEKDGRLVRLLVGTDTNGPVTTVNWGDGNLSTNAGLNPSHSYGADNTWTITVAIRYNDGGSSSCSTSVTTKAATPPPPPPGG